MTHDEERMLIALGVKAAEAIELLNGKIVALQELVELTAETVVMQAQQLEQMDGQVNTLIRQQRGF